MTARIEVPPPYLAAIVGPNPTTPLWTAPGGPAIFAYLVAGYGSVVESPIFVLKGNRPAWLGPRPICLPFTVTVLP